MSRVEVLVATIHQQDLSKYEEMNIQTNAVFANQDNRHDYSETIINGHTAKLITTSLKGLSQNRNTALSYATGEICMLADDDIIYCDGYEEAVIGAYNELPDADIILFNILITEDGRIPPQNIKKIKRINLTNFGNYGSVRITFKRTSILKKNIWFSLLFGINNLFPENEDALFLRTALKNRLKIYAYPYTISRTSSKISTWFTGYHAEYFYNKGAWVETAFPRLKLVVAAYFAMRYRNFTDISCIGTYRLMLHGMVGFRKNRSYSNWLVNQP